MGRRTARCRRRHDPWTDHRIHDRGGYGGDPRRCVRSPSGSLVGSLAVFDGRDRLKLCLRRHRNRLDANAFQQA